MWSPLSFSVLPLRLIIVKARYLCVSSDGLSKMFVTNHGWEQCTGLCGVLIRPSSAALKNNINHQVINIHLLVVNDRNVVLIMLMQSV